MAGLEESLSCSPGRDLNNIDLSRNSNFPRAVFYGSIFSLVFWAGAYLIGNEILDYFSNREQYSLGSK